LLYLESFEYKEINNVRSWKKSSPPNISIISSSIADEILKHLQSGAIYFLL